LLREVARGQSETAAPHIVSRGDVVDSGVMICAACGQENPETTKFCGECAAPLRQPPRQAAEERKVVTTLFCDRDPERAVRAGLRIVEAAEALESLPEHAFALLRRGRCLVSLGRPSEATPVLQQHVGCFTHSAQLRESPR
jgi:hypothetical protein